MAERHATRAVLALPDVRWFLVSRAGTAASHTLLHTAILWQIRELAGREAAALSLGLLGLVEFLPVVPLALLGGTVADVYDRRRTVLLAQAGELVAGLGLLAATAAAEPPLFWIYALVGALAAVRSLEGPARSALLPNLVERDVFPTAVTLSSTVQNLAWAAGPIAAGFAIHLSGVAAAYAISAALMAVALLGMARVRLRRAATAERSTVSAAAVREGLSFLRRQPAVLGAMTLDMLAVVFASVTALLPIFAQDILEVGPRGFGLLSAALQIGTLLMAGVLLVRPPLRRPGRALLVAVALFGGATIVFGLSRSFALSLLALLLAGMADQISMVARHTLIQLSTPDALRGRISAVNLIFIGASNELGAMESGFVAAATSAPFSVVFGGVVCLAVLAGIAWRVPQLARWRLEAAPS